MILYGLISYGNRRPGKKNTPILLNRNAGYVGFESSEWKDLINKSNRDISSTLMRGVEKILGFTYGSITWKTVIDSKKEFNTLPNGIYDFVPGEKYASVPPFNARDNNVCMFNFGVLEENIKFFDGQNNEHKMYLLIVLSALTHLGNRLFMMMAENNEAFQVGYDEYQIIRNFVNRNTKMRFSSSPNNPNGHGAAAIKSNYCDCQITSITETIIDSYQNFLSTHKSLHVTDTAKLKQMINNLYRTVRSVE